MNYRAKGKVTKYTREFKNKIIPWDHLMRSKVEVKSPFSARVHQIKAQQVKEEISVL